MVLPSFNLLSLNTLIYRGRLRYSRGLVGFQLLPDDNAHRLLKRTVGESPIDGFAPRSVEHHDDTSVSRVFEFPRILGGRFEYFGRDLHYRLWLEVHFR